MLGGLFSGGGAGSTEKIKEGDLAPDFTLISATGSPITLSSYRGQKNVVSVADGARLLPF